MPPTQRDYYTSEEYLAAKNANIISYLQSNGYSLAQDGRDFKGKIHDSLVIRADGRWYWNSKAIGGKSPIELLKQILIEDYGYCDDKSAVIEAVKRLAEFCGVVSNDYHSSRKLPEAVAKQKDSDVNNNSKDGFQLPEPNKSVSRVIAYLCNTRGLDTDIVKELIRQRKIYETKDYHNAVFVSYDKDGVPRHAFLRGTYTLSEKQFKKEVDCSDKSFPFTLHGLKSSSRVFCFEAAIDAISHASLYKRKGLDWHKDFRIALGGTSFLGLNRFLEENPSINHITVCLDNDQTGLRRGMKLKQEFEAKGYLVDLEFPISKDFNQDLLNEIMEEQEDEAEY